MDQRPLFSIELFRQELRERLISPDSMETQAQHLIAWLERVRPSGEDDALNQKLQELQGRFNKKVDDLEQCHSMIKAAQTQISIQQSAEMTGLLGQKSRLQEALELLQLKQDVLASRDSWADVFQVAAIPAASEENVGLFQAYLKKLNHLQAIQSLASQTQKEFAAAQIIGLQILGFWNQEPPSGFTSLLGKEEDAADKFFNLACSMDPGNCQQLLRRARYIDPNYSAASKKVSEPVKTECAKAVIAMLQRIQKIPPEQLRALEATVQDIKLAQPYIRLQYLLQNVDAFKTEAKENVLSFFQRIQPADREETRAVCEFLFLDCVLDIPEDVLKKAALQQLKQLIIQNSKTMTLQVAVKQARITAFQELQAIGLKVPADQRLKLVNQSDLLRLFEIQKAALPWATPEMCALLDAIALGATLKPVQKLLAQIDGSVLNANVPTTQLGELQQIIKEVQLLFPDAVSAQKADTKFAKLFEEKTIQLWGKRLGSDHADIQILRQDSL